MHQDRASPRGFIREIILNASGQEKSDEDRWQNGGVFFQGEGFFFFLQAFLQCHCVSGKDLGTGSAQKKNKSINVSKLS